jgi:hypothetical protein
VGDKINELIKQYFLYCIYPNKEKEIAKSVAQEQARQLNYSYRGEINLGKVDEYRLKLQRDYDPKALRYDINSRWR